MKLFLDDERDPIGDGWTVARSYEEAVSMCRESGFPDYVSFDNDLGAGQKEGWEFARFLVELDMDEGTMPADFGYYVHSQNPVAAERIRGLIDGYMEHRKNEK